MTTIRIAGQQKPQDSWVHRFRNFGEEAYVRLRDICAISIEEIDAAFDTFRITNVVSEDVLTTVSRLIHNHHLDDSVFAITDDSESSGPTVVLVVDPDFGEYLWQIAAPHPVWIVPSDANTPAVEELRRFRTRNGDLRDVTMWSAPRPATTTDDWLAMLDNIELHHGELSSDPPLGGLSVYGAALTPPIAAALRAYDYGDVFPTTVGFLALR